MYLLPAPNRFLASDILYPGPTSSNSAPDSVEPSARNCIAVVDGVDFPSVRLNLARIEPWVLFSLTSDMSFSFHVARLLSLFLKI